MRRNHKLQVTEQCMLSFEITSKFKDRVMCDVVKLDTFGMVLGSPYVYDRKVIFFREQNRYHLFKKGIEYTVYFHPIKEDNSLITVK